MDDYRGCMCLLDGKYLARCVGQNFYNSTLTFEVSPDGIQFDRIGTYGVEKQEERELGMDDVRHLLRTI